MSVRRNPSSRITSAGSRAATALITSPPSSPAFIKAATRFESRASRTRWTVLPSPDSPSSTVRPRIDGNARDRHAVPRIALRHLRIREPSRFSNHNRPRRIRLRPEWRAERRQQPSSCERQQRYQEGQVQAEQLTHPWAPEERRLHPAVPRIQPKQCDPQPVMRHSDSDAPPCRIGEPFAAFVVAQKTLQITALDEVRLVEVSAESRYMPSRR